MTVPFGPYSTVQPFFPRVAPTWVPDEDRDRVLSYGIYDQMYWSHPSTFRVKSDGNDVIYLPSPRSLIEATNRFLLPGFGWALDPNAGTPNDQATADLLLKSMFAREQFRTKFNTQRRNGLIRGDSMWHIIGDPSKAEGSRISLLELHPSSFFPIRDPADDKKIIGCYIVTLVPKESKPDADLIVQRQWYQKKEDGKIWSQLGYYELSGWDERPTSAQKVKAVAPPKIVLTPDQQASLNAQMAGFDLPDAITQLPVYHIKNMRTDNSIFGSSSIRGFEMVFNSINQLITDEDLTLALQGIGMYATTSSPPVDDEGKETTWRLGPGRVVEIDEGSTWERVIGANDLTAFKQHYDLLMTSLQQGMGVPDVALGRVDVMHAESGIALALEFGPMLAQVTEKGDEIMSVYTQMFYDIVNMWLPAYEGFPADSGVTIVPVAEDPIPVNRKDKIAEIIQLMTAGIISAQYARSLLADYGYRIPDDMAEQVDAERAKAAASLDPYGGRIAADLAIEAANAGAGAVPAGGAPSSNGATAPPAAGGATVSA